MTLDRQFDSTADVLRKRLCQNFSILDNLDQFLTAASKGDLDLLKLLIDDRADSINSANETGEAALNKVVKAGHLGIITFLLDRGANVDAVRADSIRPINCAMKNGADINAVDEEYNSNPLGIASRWGNSAMVTFLLKSKPIRPLRQQNGQGL